MNINPENEIKQNATELCSFLDKTDLDKDGNPVCKKVMYEPQYGVVVEGARTDGSVKSAVKLISKLSVSPINEDNLVTQLSNWIRGEVAKPVETEWSAEDEEEESEEEEDEFDYSDDGDEDEEEP